MESVKKFGSRQFLGVREKLSNGKFGHYQWKTYKEIHEEVEAFRRGLHKLVDVKTQECVGFYSANRIEWKLAEYTCMLSNLCIVSLYDTLAPGAAQFIIKHAELRIIFASGAVWNKLCQAIKSLDPKECAIKYVILFDHVENADAAKSLPFQILYFDEVLKLVKKK